MWRYRSHDVAICRNTMANPVHVLGNPWRIVSLRVAMQSVS